MTFRGTFDPTGFNPGDPDTFPPTSVRVLQAAGFAAIELAGAPILLDTNPIGIDIPEETDILGYLDGDEWAVTADGTFAGLTLKAGGRLIARVT